MSKGKLIKVCGECANYDWKKHRCKLGCNEGEPQEPFFTDCPLPTVDTKPTEWISVDERLPDKQAQFLIVDDEGYMEIALWTRQFGWFSHINRGNKVTHWMPLPEPPMMKGD